MIKIDYDSSQTDLKLNPAQIRCVVVPSALATKNIVTLFLGSDVIIEMKHEDWEKFALVDAITKHLESARNLQ